MAWATAGSLEMGVGAGVKRKLAISASPGHAAHRPRSADVGVELDPVAEGRGRWIFQVRRTRSDACCSSLKIAAMPPTSVRVPPAGWSKKATGSFIGMPPLPMVITTLPGARS